MSLTNKTLAMADDSHSMTINDEIRLMGGSKMMKKTSPRSRMSSLAAVPLHLSTLLVTVTVTVLVAVLVLSTKPRALPLPLAKGTGHAPLMSGMSMRRSTRWWMVRESDSKLSVFIVVRSTLLYLLLVLEL